MATPEKQKKSGIGQRLTPACCTRQYEHIDIKRVAYNHVTAMMPKRPKCVVILLLLLCHTFFPRDFSGAVEDTDIINTPLEPLRPADVPFGGFVDIAPHFWSEIPLNPQFWGVNRRFQAKRAKY